MAVHPDFWGHGIGSRLMEAALELAYNWLDLKRIELDVNTDNPTGIRLYKKFDFAVEGVKRFHTYGDGRWVDSYFMARIRKE
jgi:putative acetyltransferase